MRTKWIRKLLHKEIDRIMKEKKNELGKVFVEEEGKERGIEIESVFSWFL